MTLESQLQDKGLYPKYEVRKVSTGEAIADCFILRPERDDWALSAIETYAAVCAGEAPLLSANLFTWAQAIREGGER